MIKSFANKRTELIFRREFVKGMSSEICRMAQRRLLFLDEADSLNDVQAIAQDTTWKNLKEIRRVSSAFASTTGGGSALIEETEMLLTLKW